MSEIVSPAGPYTVWTYYGVEGWHPTSFATLSEAVQWHRNGTDTYIITKHVDFTIIECALPEPSPRQTIEAEA